VNKPVNLVYGPRFFARRYKMNWRAVVICDAIDNVFHPTCLVDVGCATGDLLKEWVCRNVFCIGIEGSEAVKPFLEIPERLVLFEDLRSPLKLDLTFDLATCFEVAEHIDAAYAPMFVKNLVSLSSQILMSTAPPGQDGHGHVNCQPVEYWDEQFARYKYVRKDEITTAVRAGLEMYKHKPGVKAIYLNLMYYEKDQSTSLTTEE